MNSKQPGDQRSKAACNVKPFTALSDWRKQAAILARIFELDIAQQMQIPSIPPSAEGRMVRLNPKSLASTYGEAVEIKIEALQKARGKKQVRYLWDFIKPEYLHPTRQLDIFQEELQKKQSGPLFVVPLQLSFYQRISVSDACGKMQTNEVGLGISDVLDLLLTHDGLLGERGQFGLCCAGNSSTLPNSYDTSPAITFTGDEFVVIECSKKLPHGCITVPSMFY